MSEKLKIKISIANRVYPLIIDPKKEESLRIAAQEINSLVKKIEENYSVQDKQDALAMCALQISANKKQSIIKDNELINELENKIDPDNPCVDSPVLKVISPLSPPSPFPLLLPRKRRAGREPLALGRGHRR